MTITIVISIITFICLCVCICIQENKIRKLAKRFDKIIDKHNAFVDAVRDEFDNIYDETNDRIDEINNEFHNVYEVLNSNKEFADDVTDTMELMCDTDEIVIDRLRDFEEALAITNVTLDEIIEQMFKDQPEEAEKPAKKSKKK